MPIKLNGATSGSVELDVPAVVSGGDILIDIEPLKNFSTTGLVPPGSVIYIATSAAPSGYLKANGATVNRVTYSDLFTAVGVTFGAGNGSTTFVLPDLRGEFLRAFDDGRGVDSGRTFGTAQAAQVLEHTHTFRYNNTSHPSDFGSGGSYLTAKSTGLTRISSPGSNSRIGSMIDNFGGADGRPRNIALLACIKY